MIWALWKWKALKVVLKNISGKRLVHVQSFRILVELSLWSLFVLNLLPVHLTFEGWNWDVLIGLSAPFISWFVFKKGKPNRPLLIFWNVVGVLVLLNIIFMAILSAPTPFQVFFQEPANTIIVKYPFVFLPGFIAPFALFLHFLSFKQAFIQ